MRDLLFLNEGNGPDGHARFREVGRQAGIDPKPYDHSLGAVFTDLNGDGRLDLYVANDEDPNRLYVNEPGGPLGFHFVDRARGAGLADANAGMGIARGRLQPRRAARPVRHQLARAEPRRLPQPRRRRSRTPSRPSPTAFGTNFTGWGDSWVDLNNDGRLDLVLANGAIPVTNLAKDAGPVQVLENVPGGFANATALVGAGQAAARRTAAGSPPPTSTTTATSTSRSTRSAAG